MKLYCVQCGTVPHQSFCTGFWPDHDDTHSGHIGGIVGTCHYCGVRMRMTRDHKVARAVDRSVHVILPSCSRCNNKKGTRDYFEFIAWLREDPKGINWLRERLKRVGLRLDVCYTKGD